MPYVREQSPPYWKLMFRLLNGGLDLGVIAAVGGSVAWHVEYDKAPSRVLAHRWPDVPNYGDVKTTVWSDVEPVDILTAGYPCQPFSVAGKRKGVKDDRHLWPAVCLAIGNLRPGLVVLENVRGHVSLGLDAVIGDLSGVGYDARWGIIRASDVGACHNRARLFIVATDASSGSLARASATRNGLRIAAERGDLSTDASGEGLEGRRTERGGATPPLAAPDRPSTDASRQRHRRGEDGRRLGRLDDTDAGPTRERERAVVGDRDTSAAFGVYAPAVNRWADVIGRPAPSPTEPGKTGPRLSPPFVEWMMGLDDGHVTDPAIGLTRTQQLKALGNGVVPQQAAAAIRLLVSA